MPGSSPHTRDKFEWVPGERVEFGIIPAYAGQIVFKRNSQYCFRDHPRIRGTNRSKVLLAVGSLGSSPHTRDKSTSSDSL